MNFRRRGRKPKAPRKAKRPPKNLAAWPDAATANVPMNRPKLRGVFHALGLLLWLPFAGAMLALLPEGTPRASAGLFAASVAAIFGVSALYHRRTWTPAGLDRMKRLDHATIGLGTTGILCAFALALRGWPGAQGAIAWQLVAMAFPVARALGWPDAPKALGAALGVGLVVVAFPLGHQALATLPPDGVLGIVAGNAVLGLGVLAYALNRPNPWPGVVGYHEVFHLATVVGIAGYAWALWGLLRGLGPGL